MCRLVLVGLAAGCAGGPEPGLLGDAIEMSALQAHLAALQEVADAGDGTRAAGTAGYDGSVDYVIEQLDLAGIDAERVPFDVDLQDTHAASVERLGDAPKTWTLGDGPDGIEVFFRSGSGDVTADLVGVDLLVPVPDGQESTSGCESDDFAGFPAGAVALLQRGGCFFRDKATNAIDAGASAVLVFNDGVGDRTEPIAANLRELVVVPVLGIGSEVGYELAASMPVQVRVITDVALRTESQDNVIATLEGDSDRVVMLGAHLDSVSEGPGINDNGSGSVFVLETAIQAAAMDRPPRHSLRFAWWGAEELGLIGSFAWVESQSDADLDVVDAYLNFDMMASPNGIPLRYDSDDSDELGFDHPTAAPAAGGAVEAAFLQGFDAQGVFSGQVDLGIGSDSYGFVSRRVPTGGVFSGASSIMQPSWVTSFGRGVAGEPLDPCYHRACDTTDNIDPVLYGELAFASAWAVQELAWRRGKDPLAAGDIEAP